MIHELLKRLKALGWSIAMMIVAMSIDWFGGNLDLLHLEPEQTVFLGLILAQVSKAIHNCVTRKTPVGV